MRDRNWSRAVRGLRQQLESLRRAGVTYRPRRPMKTVADAQGSTASREASVAVAVSPPVTPRAGTLFDERPPEEESVGAAALSPEGRKQELAVLAEQVAGCTRCGELAETRTQTVFGVGNPSARLLFVGEAPGADEDRQGEPFVGRAGQLLNRIIEACRLRREDVYICNILKCRPPGNRNPTAEEASHCRVYLNGQIETVDPDYIVCWGSVAAQNLLDVTTSIGRLRGRFHSHGRAKVLCTYHPSYLLRNPAAKKDVWNDMKLLFSDMGVELD